MRKLTGYIGALIIVFALMGSIFAGYALNVNGSSSVINEYERVTDVSGLYSHTQEPSYIDYNPASNYIGYEQETITYTSDAGVMTYKDLQYGELATIKTSGEITINGLSEGVAPIGTVYYFTNQFYIERKSDGNIGISSVVGGITATSDVTVSTNGSNTTVSTTGFNVTFQSIWHNVCYWNIDNTYNYYRIDGRLSGNNTDYNAYFRTSNDILTLSYVAPSLYSNDPSTFSLLITQGGGYGLLGNNAVFGATASQWIANTRTPVYGGGYEINPNYQPVTDYWTDVNTPGNKTMTGIWIFYPRSISNGGGVGIDYTESSRVNNYPVPGNNDNPITTQTQTINISNLNGISNYYPSPSYNYHVVMYENGNTGQNSNGVKYSNIGLEIPYKPVTGDEYELINYKLSDILTNGATIPANTKSIKIELNSNNPVAYNRNLNQTNVISYCDLNIPCLNDGTFQNTTIPISHFRDYTMKTNNGFGTKDYAIYNIQDNTVTVYSYDGVKKSVLAPENCYIVSPKLSGFDPSNQRLMVYSYEYREPSGGSPYWEITEYYTSNSPGYPYSDSNNYTTNINLTYYIQENPDNRYYDITKGYAIKNDNVYDVIWDNEYNNGNIQLLFRAENPNATYHNDITVGDNTISIDYADNSFSVTLNGGDPVAVGKWRNIVLNMDLRTGDLSVIPVRTFNSYTNVVLDTASIVIGDMINPAPTNIIEWAPTPNSLMFNVYSTAVFMNTYGVVMVNPQLDITEYFTDLNGFYRMRLYNFSVLGSSITVNGVTSDVSNNSITIDDQTVQVKDMAITYADGHAYISDSNVNIDLGEVVNNNISMAGAWYFETELLKGYTSQKMVYTWDWSDFILNNTQFCIMYIGIALIGLIVARRYCSLSITDYIVLIASFAIALTVQVVA